MIFNYTQCPNLFLFLVRMQAQNPYIYLDSAFKLKPVQFIWIRYERLSNS